MSHNGLIFLIILLDSLGFAMIGLGILLGHNEVIAPHRALMLCNLGGLALLLSIAVVHLLVMRKGGFLVGLVLCCLTLAALAAGATQTPLYQLPWINDVSTDHETPPPLVVTGEAAPVEPPLPPEFVPHIKQHYGDLKHLLTPRPPDEMLARAAEVLKGLPGVTEVRMDPARGLVHAVEITPLMRFRDDFVVRVRAEGSGSRVDARSRSRVGKSDLGANAARVRRVLAAVDRSVR